MEENFSLCMYTFRVIIYISYVSYMHVPIDSQEHLSNTEYAV